MDRPLQTQQEIIRVPLYNVGLQGTGNNQTSTPKSWDQAYVNCWPSFRESKLTGERDVLIQKRPGNLNVDVSVPTSVTVSGSGIYTIDALSMTQVTDRYVVAVISMTESKIYIIARNATGSTLINLGSFTYTSTSPMPKVYMIETTVAGAPGIYLNFIDSTTTTTKSYYAATTAGAFTAASLTQVTDADYPTQLATPDPLVGAPVQMNGTLYVMGKSGKIYNSDLNSVTAWNALGVKEAISYPDKGVTLMRYKHHIVAFGEDSTEFFNDAGLPPPGSPLQRTDQAFIKFGLRNAKSVCNIKDTLYWISNSNSELLRFYKLDGYTPVLLDTENYFQTYSRQDTFLNPISYMGHTHLVVSGEYQLPNNTSTLTGINTNYGVLMLDTDTNIFWYQARSSFTSTVIFQTPGGIPNLLALQSTAPGNTTDTQYVINNAVDYGTGTYYGWAFLSTSTTDQFQAVGDAYINTGGTSYIVPIYSAFCTNPVEFGNYSRKFLRRVTVTTDLLENSNIYLTVNKDGWWNPPQATQYRTAYVPLGSPAVRISYNNFGQARRFYFTVSMFTPAPIVIRGLELIVSQGTH